MVKVHLAAGGGDLAELRAAGHGEYGGALGPVGGDQTHFEGSRSLGARGPGGVLAGPDRQGQKAQDELTRLAEELADRFRGIPGAERVRVYGAAEEEVTITLDRGELAEEMLEATREAMLQQLNAERARRAAVTEAEGQKRATELQADGEFPKGSVHYLAQRRLLEMAEIVRRREGNGDR